MDLNVGINVERRCKDDSAQGFGYTTGNIELPFMEIGRIEKRSHWKGQLGTHLCTCV
jgi:hypothetical protein